MSVKPPKRTPRAGRAARSRLERILDAAEQVAHDGGFEALTLRALAARLEAAPMALYRYVATKDELVNALLDRVLGRFPTRDFTSDDWVDDLRQFALAHRQLLVDHPWALAGFFSHPSPGRNATRVGEVALAILRRAGFSNELSVAVFGGVLALNYGWAAFFTNRSRASGAAAEQVRHALSSLPSAEFPHTAAVAREMADYASVRHYDLVLEQLLVGIQAAAPR